MQRITRLMKLILVPPFLLASMVLYCSAVAFRILGRGIGGDSFDENFPYIREILRKKDE